METLRTFVPEPDVAMAVGVIALVYVIAVGAAAAWLRRDRGWQTGYTRKVFHFLVFSAAGVVQLVWGLGGVVVFGSVASLRVLVSVARGGGDPLYEALARPSDAPHRSVYIVVPMITTAIGGVLSNVLFAPFAYVGYLVCGWGDAVGEPVGLRWGRHRYRVPSLLGVPATRSLEGSAAVAGFGMAAALLALVLAGREPLAALPAALLCGAAGALIEAVSTHGLDNLTVQLAASGAAWWLLT